MTPWIAMGVLGCIGLCLIAFDRGWFDGAVDSWGTRSGDTATTLDFDLDTEDAVSAKETLPRVTGELEDKARQVAGVADIVAVSMTANAYAGVARPSLPERSDMAQNSTEMG